MTANPSLRPTCYGLRPTHAAELKRFRRHYSGRPFTSMYPAELLSLFPPYPRNHVVFVAMSFDTQFDPLWTDVLQPAVAEVKWDGGPLNAHRVDLTRKSDSIITEIVQHIAEARLILADISTTGWIRRGFRKLRPIRNSNVMYEVGIAHAARLPEEVVLVRGDADVLDFDVAGVRVHQYPSDHLEAKREIIALLVDALKAVDQRRSLAIRRALRSLSPPMFALLHAMSNIAHPNASTFGQLLASQKRLEAIRQLLAEGMLQAVYEPLPTDFMERPVADLFGYRRTEFGTAVYDAARTELRFNDAVVPWLRSPQGQAWVNQAVSRAKPSPGS